MNQTDYMEVALKLAKKAFENNDIPVGAIIVNEQGRIIGRGYNQKEKKQNPTKHAEIIAINQACQRIESWRLTNCTIYTTLEPCMMCLGAILQARINTVVYALNSTKFGVLEQLALFNSSKKINYYVKTSYQLAVESKNMLQTFFTNLRN